MFQGFVDQLMALAEALDNLRSSASIGRSYTCIYHCDTWYRNPGGLVAPMCIHMTSLKPDMLERQGVSLKALWTS